MSSYLLSFLLPLIWPTYRLYYEQHPNAKHSLFALIIDTLNFLLISYVLHSTSIYIASIAHNGGVKTKGGRPHSKGSHNR